MRDFRQGVRSIRNPYNWYTSNSLRFSGYNKFSATLWGVVWVHPLLKP